MWLVVSKDIRILSPPRKNTCSNTFPFFSARALLKFGTALQGADQCIVGITKTARSVKAWAKFGPGTFTGPRPFGPLEMGGNFTPPSKMMVGKLRSFWNGPFLEDNDIFRESSLEFPDWKRKVFFFPFWICKCGELEELKVENREKKERKIRVLSTFLKKNRSNRRIHA